MQKTVETNQDVVDLVEKNKWKRLGVTLAKDWRLYVLLIPMLLFLIFFKYIPVYGILTGFKWGADNTNTNYLWNGLYWFNRILGNIKSIKLHILMLLIFFFCYFFLFRFLANKETRKSK